MNTKTNTEGAQAVEEQVLELFILRPTRGQGDTEQVLLTMDELKQALHTAEKRALDNLSDWIEHSNQCIRSQSSAGRPTEDGGYECKFAGKWYQSLPIDKTPKCDCGLDEAITNITNDHE